jgi:hypothetical protein
MKAARPAVQDACPVMIDEQQAFLGDSVDVRRAASHHAAVIGADVPDADIVAHDEEDVGRLPISPCRRCALGSCRYRRTDAGDNNEQTATHQNFAAARPADFVFALHCRPAPVFCRLPSTV